MPFRLTSASSLCSNSAVGIGNTHCCFVKTDCSRAAKGAGGDTGEAFEGFGEVVDIGETARFSDLAEGEIGGLQERLGMLDAQAEEILVGGEAKLLAKDDTEARRREIGAGGNIGH